MNALALLTPPAAPVRLFALAGDAMGDDVRHGDMLVVATVDRYVGEGVYLLDHGDGEAPYVAERRIGNRPVIMARHPNPKYATWELSVEDFTRAVRAKVVAEVKMRDAALLRRVTA